MNPSENISGNTAVKEPSHKFRSEMPSGFSDLEESLDTLKGYAHTASEFIKQRPVTVILAAVAIGATAALIGSSLKSKKLSS